MSNLFGRTNIAVPRLWLKLLSGGSDPDQLIEAASQHETVLDVTSNPGLWGHFLRGNALPISVRLGAQLNRATDEKVAFDLIQAELISLLSCLGRQRLEFVFLRFGRPLEESALNGFFGAIEAAHEDGIVGNLGLSVEGSPIGALGMWQFRDAFEMLRVRRNPVQHVDYDTLAGLAQSRRVGVLTHSALNWGNGLPFFTGHKDGKELASRAAWTFAQEHPVQVGVRTPSEIHALFEQSRDRIEDWSPWIKMHTLAAAISAP